MNTYGAFGSVTKERTEVVIDLSHFYVPFYTNLVGQFHVHRFFSFFHTGGVGGHHCLEPRGPSCEMGGVRVQMQTWQVDSNNINNINNIINNRNDINNIKNIHYINIMNNNNNKNKINNINNLKQHEQYQHKQHKQVDKGTVLHLTVPLSSGLVDVVCSLPEVSTEPLAGGNT